MPSINGTTPTTDASSTGKPSVQPSEVGWLFVPQYYTFLNSDPSKMHCFYTKKSTLVHGMEQEEAPLCFGQQVSKFTNFCKVKSYWKKMVCLI